MSCVQTDDDEHKTGECRRCGKRGTVFVDNDLCEDCDGDVVHCKICNEEQSIDSRCRHVFYSSESGWNGAGVGYPDDEVKDAFLDLVRRMGNEFSQDLQRAVRSGEFYTFLVAPLIGGGGMLDLHGMPWHLQRKWGELLIDLGEGDEAGDLADGYHWLASIYKTKTPDANEITLAWLAEVDDEVAVARLVDEGCPWTGEKSLS